MISAVKYRIGRGTGRLYHQSHIHGSLYSGSNSTHTSSLPLLHCDRRRLLVEPDSETLQLICDDLQVVERLQHVQDDKDQVARSGDSDDLSTTTFTIFGTFNNT